MSPELRAELGAKAVAAAKAVGYVGAGTVEVRFWMFRVPMVLNCAKKKINGSCMQFIMDAHGKFYYMEMNTR